MAETTGIKWTNSTFNPWWGCSKVGPGCDHCYAETLDSSTGGDHWGPRKTPRTMSRGNWRLPRQWQKEAAATGIRRKVFSGSMCDWADKNAPEGQRDRLWALIQQTPDLDWQLLTKRSPNIRKYLPADWGDQGYDNVWLGVTVEDRKHGIPRIDTLRDIPAKVRFLSIEPLYLEEAQKHVAGLQRREWQALRGEWASVYRKAEADARRCLAGKAKPA